MGAGVEAKTGRRSRLAIHTGTYTNGQEDLTNLGGIVYLAGSIAMIGGLIGVGKVGWDAWNAPLEQQQRRIQEVQNELSGSFNVVDLRTIPGFQVNGNVNGFLAISGQLNGETMTFIEFAWQTKGQTPEPVISVVPTDKVTFVITDNPNPQTYHGPTVKFTLDTGKLQDDDFKNGSLDVNNPNAGIKDLRSVEFDMSKADFEAFRGTSNIGK